MEPKESLVSAVQQSFTWLRSLAALVNGLATSLTAALQQLKGLGAALRKQERPVNAPASYETRRLALVLDIHDRQGRRAVLSRVQRVRFLAADGAVVRELVWGEGEQLVRYVAHGARRMRVRPEGSKRAVLLDPEQRPSAGDELTITSRRTLRDAFRKHDEYCEVLLERPTEVLDITIQFPVRRPPQQAVLVSTVPERVLRVLRARYGSDGRAVIRCRLRTPAIGTTYSVRWRW